MAINSSVSVGVASTQILGPATFTRSNLIITNISDSDVYIAFGAPAELSKGVPLKANGGTISLSRDGDEGFLSSEINAISSGASKTLTYSLI